MSVPLLVALLVFCTTIGLVLGWLLGVMRWPLAASPAKNSLRDRYPAVYAVMQTSRDRQNLAEVSINVHRARARGRQRRAEGCGSVELVRCEAVAELEL